MSIKHFRVTGTTAALTGKLSLQIPIPGTFPGDANLQPNNSNWSGRTIITAEAMFQTGVFGDYVTNIIVSDVNNVMWIGGVLPAPLQAQFPNYPIVGDRMDLQAPADNQGLWLIPGVFKQLIVNPVSIVSGLVLSADFYTATPRVDSVWVNLYWDDGT